MLIIKGCIVTIGSMGCQKKIARKIVEDCHSDYVLSVKGNKEGLMNDIVECFHNTEISNKTENLNIAYSLTNLNSKLLGDESLSMIRTIEKGHGGIEKRSYYYTQDIDWMLDAKKDWFGLNGVGMVFRETDANGIKSTEQAYFIGSISSVKQFEKLSKIIGRSKVCTGILMLYKDDANKTRKGCAPQNMAVVKRIAFKGQSQILRLIFYIQMLKRYYLKNS